MNSLFPILAAPFLAALAPAVAQEVPHEQLARLVLAEAGMADASPETVSLEDVLARAFVRSDLGLFELYVPRHSLSNERHAQDYRTLALALLDLQATWLDWLDPRQGTELADVRADFALTRDWVGSWKRASLAAARLSTGPDALELLAADESTSTAVRRFADAMCMGSALGLGREDARAEPVVLCPERRDFVGMASLGGWLYPQDRGVFWQPAIAGWTYCYIGRHKLLALEFAAGGASASNWQSGVGMDARSPTGTAEQVVQLCANSMLDNYYGDRVPPSFAGALAVNLVIELYGQCNTRVDGDLRERRTSAREVFVPGGASEGGLLPAHLADSRWRESHGSDHFVDVLRAAQVAGAKERRDKDKQGWFQLEDDAGARTAVHAPFFGAAAVEPPASEESYKWDRLEFLRAYGSCFVWWLQNESASTEKTSEQQFAALLRALATAESGAVVDAFPRAFEGLALSSPSPSKKDLEGRFLAWLAKQ